MCTLDINVVRSFFVLLVRYFARKITLPQFSNSCVSLNTNYECVASHYTKIMKQKQTPTKRSIKQLDTDWCWFWQLSNDITWNSWKTKQFHIWYFWSIQTEQKKNKIICPCLVKMAFLAHIVCMFWLIKSICH